MENESTIVDPIEDVEEEADERDEPKSQAERPSADDPALAEIAREPVVRVPRPEVKQSR